MQRGLPNAHVCEFCGSRVGGPQSKDDSEHDEHDCLVRILKRYARRGLRDVDERSRPYIEASGMGVRYPVTYAIVPGEYLLFAPVWLVTLLERNELEFNRRPRGVKRLMLALREDPENVAIARAAAELGAPLEQIMHLVRRRPRR